jgi:pyridoxine 5-phosphate synthase
MRNLIISVDAIAAIREDRKEKEPDPVTAAAFAELAGADGIAIHLRMDKRHVRERDLYILRETVKTRLILYITPSPEMVTRALEVKPSDVTLVSERSGELTTEAGLNFSEQSEAIREAVEQIKAAGCSVFAVVEPDNDAIKSASKAGFDGVELFTHHYRETESDSDRCEELQRLVKSIESAKKHELHVRAAGGLNYQNIIPLLSDTDIAEFVVGHSIVARAVLTGFERAVKELVDIVKYF